MKIRVLVVGPTSPRLGGMATVTASLVTASVGCESVQITTLDLMANGWRGFPSALIELRRLQRRSDVVHFQVAADGSAVRKLIASRFVSRPFVVHIHSGRYDTFARTFLGRHTSRMLFRRAAAAVALEPRMAKLIAQLGANAVSVVSNGVVGYPLPLKPPESQCSQTPSCAQHSRQLLFVGNLSHAKGLDNLLSAWSSVERANWRLLAVGPGDPTFYKLLSRNLGVADSVDFAGVVCGEALVNLVDDSDAIVLPSLSEGQPMVLLEAMSRAKGFIASRLPGIVAIDQSQRFSRQPMAGDQLELALALQNLIDHPCEWRALGLIAVKVWQESFTAKRMLSELSHVWRAAT